ncbi:hypothetical protein GCM10011579_091970 [Streptomyces albiflavescens]|uniref:Uncharacterized protein n=1 Tax=Streptomyces albiflavescens TaxID=1623582 RepID=A0A917YGC0_9ACTN|nr:hypothetical protein GCM10011579_091970 [Streptomyces albiflavescens]
MCMHELMVSSHMVWHDMHASTQSCISLLIAVMVPAWVMAPPRGGGARDGPRVRVLPWYAPRPRRAIERR